MTEQHKTRIISKTIERMAASSHLPGDLVTLLGQTALLQAEADIGLALDLTGFDFSSPDSLASPLCPADQLPLDPTHFKALADRILDLVLTPDPGMPEAMIEAAKAVIADIEAGTLDLETPLAEVLGRFAGNPDTPVLTAWEDRFPQTPAFLSFLVAAAAAPCLEAGAAGLAEAAGLVPDRINAKGACPVCGSPPFMLELRGKEGQRFGHCACCRHTYRIRRIACPCCDSDDVDAQTYFTADQEPGFRVETCSKCKTYIKTIDFRNLDREAFAPLNDLESLPLDILAEQEGYARTAPSVWQI
jgi:FdhE protein